MKRARKTVRAIGSQRLSPALVKTFLMVAGDAILGCPALSLATSVLFVDRKHPCVFVEIAVLIFPVLQAVKQEVVGQNLVDPANGIRLVVATFRASVRHYTWAAQACDTLPMTPSSTLANFAAISS